MVKETQILKQQIPMSEKGLKSNSTYNFCSSPWFTRRLLVLLMGFCVGVLVLWSIDGRSIRNGLEALGTRRDYLGFKLHSLISSKEIHENENETHHSSLSHSSPNSTQFELDFTPNSTYNSFQSSANSTQVESAQFPTNLTQVESVQSSTNSSQLESVQSSTNSTQLESVQSSTNSTQLESVHEPNVTLPMDGPILNLTEPQVPQTPKEKLNWISVELEQNLTSNLITRLFSKVREPCQDILTVEIAVPGLDGQQSIALPTGEIHEFIFNAVDDNGNQRCMGGDYFETDLSGESWKSRPPVKDLGNGSYSMLVQVHHDFVGEYNLTIVLLFRKFHGLRFSPERFSYQRELRRIPIKFYKGAAQVPELHICKKSDLVRDVWSGRWTRHAKNDKCEISFDGRYRCLEPEFPCKKPWCFGSLASLESNGWVYSTHCSFEIFSTDSAWNCLQNRWIFFWGDSNHVDSIRNLLNFVLGLPEIKSVPRRFDMNFTNPSNPAQSVRITSIFNGHWNETKNYEGLNSLQNIEYQDLLKRYFSEETVPDTMIMNSGLHDGVHWRSLKHFSYGAEFAAKFWDGVLESVKKRGLKVPKFLYRTTVATGGYARNLAFNPQKMEAFNQVVLDKLKNTGILSGVIDDFDMTFPWHFDNRCNDGVHYGRAPAKLKWRDGEIGHQYFVDLMLGHVLLNALCAR